MDPILETVPEKLASDLPRPDDVAELVWVDAAATALIDRDAERLDLLLQDPRDFDFAAAIVDRVIRPEERSRVSRPGFRGGADPI